MKTKIAIRLPSGEIITRVPKYTQLGNFVMITINYKREVYIVGDGDEYLRGMPEVFELDLKRKVKR